MTEMEEFHPRRIADRILGMGDIVSLVEKAAENIDADKARAMAEKMAKGKFDLNDLAEQLKQMQSLGGMGGIMGLMPGMSGMKDKLSAAGMSDKTFARHIAIIQSMTRAERANPDMLKHSRKKRIASRLRHGCGRNQQASENAPPDGRHDENDGRQGQGRHDEADDGRPCLEDGPWWRGRNWNGRHARSFQARSETARSAAEAGRGRGLQAGLDAGHAGRWHAGTWCAQAARPGRRFPGPSGPAEEEVREDTPMIDPEVKAKLSSYRQSIDNIDAALVHMLAERFRCTKEVGVLKAQYELAAGRPGARRIPDRATSPPGEGSASGPGFRREVPELRHQGSHPAP
jgi:hypothetical protein